MPEHGLLRDLAVFLLDVERLCAVAKPALLAIDDFLLFLVGLVGVVWLVVRRHRA